MPFPKEIDNTIREAFVVCPTKARRAYIEDLAAPTPSVHLHYGGATAEGLEKARRAFYEQGRLHEEAVEAGVQAALDFYGDFNPPALSLKTRENLANSIRYYFTIWPMTMDSYRPKRMEWRFRVPIPGLVHPDDQGEIFYTGRPDTLGEVGTIDVVEDDKTATSLGASWGKQWLLDSQFTGYRWAAAQEGLLDLDGPGAVLIRGLATYTPKFKTYLDENGTEIGTTGAQKGRPIRKEYVMAESFGHDQALVYRPRWMVERWLGQLQRDVRRMIHSYLNNEWDYALHKNACAAYGGCPFLPLCSAEDPEGFIPGNYVKRKWDPLSVV